MLNQVDNALSVLEKLVSMIESGQPQSDRSDLLQRRVYLEMVSCHARKKNLDKASNYAKKVVAEKQNILIDTLQTFGLLAQADSYLYAYYNLDVDLHNFEIAHCIADNATIHSNTPISRDIAEKQVLENIAALANAMDDPMRETSIRIFLYKKENNIENKLYHLRVVKKWVDRSPCSELFKQDIAFQLNY